MFMMLIGFGLVIVIAFIVLQIYSVDSTSVTLNNKVAGQTIKRTDHGKYSGTDRFQEAGKNFCSNCGEILDLNSRFCSNCGIQV